MASVRTVKTASAATAVQVVWASRQLVSTEYLSSVRDERELESLKAAARPRPAAGHLFTWPWPTGPSSRPRA